MSNILSVAFRLDGGRRLGMGHTNRCLSIAQYLKGKGIECFFLVSNPSILDAISPYGKVIRIMQSSEKQDIVRFLLAEKDCKVLIIDSKRDSIFKVLENVRKKVKTVVMDNTKYHRSCDLVVLPGVREQFTKYPKNALVGPEYVLLNPSFKVSATSYNKRNGGILFSAGSTDKFDITKVVISAFKRSTADFRMTVVLGRFYKYTEVIKRRLRDDPRFTILIDPQDFSELLGSHSLGIFTFGISVYEAAAARLPILVISHSNENDSSAKRVERYAWMRYVGKYDKIDYDKVVNETLALLADRILLKRMSDAGKLVDDKGSHRVGNIVIHLMKGRDPLQAI